MPKKKKVNILNMMDHLEFVNMSVEGAALFKSMADSIRSALEKGILLERLIVKEKIDNLNRNYKDEVLERERKKLAREGNASSVILGSSRLKTNSSCSQNNGSEGNNIQSESSEMNGSRERSKSVCSNSSENQTHSKLIRLADSSLLFKSNEVDFSTPSSVGYGSDSHGKSACNQYMSNSSCGSLSAQGNKSTCETNSKSLETAQNELEPRNNHNLPSNSAFTSSSNQANNSQDQPVMPSPIVIKSECNTVQNNASDPFINISDSNWNDGQDCSLNDGMACFEESETNNQSNEFQIFFTVSKDTTEDDVSTFFKKLDVTRFRMIQHKPTHNFGFVTFSSEEHMKIAISMNKRNISKGDSIMIRPYFKNRQKIFDNYDASNRNENCNNCQSPQMHNMNSFQNKEKTNMIERNSFSPDSGNQEYNASDNFKRFKSDDDQPTQFYNRNNSFKKKADFNDKRNTDMVHPRFSGGRGKSPFHQKTIVGLKNTGQRGSRNQNQGKINKKR